MYFVCVCVFFFNDVNRTKEKGRLGRDRKRGGGGGEIDRERERGGGCREREGIRVICRSSE